MKETEVNSYYLKTKIVTLMYKYKGKVWVQCSVALDRLRL